MRLPAAVPSAPAVEATAGWQDAATDTAGVPATVLQAASRIEIAIVDTGADLSSPAIASKHPLAYDAVTGTKDVTDVDGHGTLVASIAAGASNPSAAGVVGVGGAARLLIVKTATAGGLIPPPAEAAAIRYAVTHGARIVNLSFAGSTTSPAERSAIRFAVARGALVVAAAGNAYAAGNPIEYPAALLQPVGSNGRGGTGLVVGASGRDGNRAPFSSAGSWISLSAPGVQIAGALPANAASEFLRFPLASAGAVYGYGSGTSFAAPQVSGAAALVWAANPALTAQQVAQILKQTASGHGTWTPQLGYGVIDVAAAVALAAQTA